MYTLSNTLNYSNYVYEYAADDSFIKYTAVRGINTFTTTATTAKIKFRSTATEIQNDLSVKYQLQYGSIVSDYEEPNKYIINIQSCENNLLNESNYKVDVNSSYVPPKWNGRRFHLKNNSASTKRCSFWIRVFLEKGKTYTLSRYNLQNIVGTAELSAMCQIHFEENLSPSSRQFA